MPPPAQHFFMIWRQRRSLVTTFKFLSLPWKNVGREVARIWNPSIIKWNRLYQFYVLLLSAIWTSSAGVQAAVQILQIYLKNSLLPTKPKLQAIWRPLCCRNIVFHCDLYMIILVFLSNSKYQTFLYLDQFVENHLLSPCEPSSLSTFSTLILNINSRIERKITLVLN